MLTASFPNTARMREIKFKSLSSGSCGNCYFTGIFSRNSGKSKCECGVLIDAGVSPRRLKKELFSEEIPLECLSGVLITHDHNDHIRSLCSYCKHLKLPVWLSPTLVSALKRRESIAKMLTGYSRELGKGWNDIADGRIKAQYFELPHDATHTVGYLISLDEYKLLVMTDLGTVTHKAEELAGLAQSVVIESNYDEEMLLTGTYPKELQDRIRGGHGHLSNEDCATAVSRFAHPELQNVFLCHLSEHNNKPELALECTRATAPSHVKVEALPRQTPSPLYTLSEI